MSSALYFPHLCAIHTLILVPHRLTLVTCGCAIWTVLLPATGSGIAAETGSMACKAVSLLENDSFGVRKRIWLSGGRLSLPDSGKPKAPLWHIKDAASSRQAGTVPGVACACTVLRTGIPHRDMVVWACIHAPLQIYSMHERKFTRALCLAMDTRVFGFFFCEVVSCLDQTCLSQSPARPLSVRISLLPNNFCFVHVSIILLLNLLLILIHILPFNTMLQSTCAWLILSAISGYAPSKIHLKAIRNGSWIAKKARRNTSNAGM